MQPRRLFRGFTQPILVVPLILGWLGLVLFSQPAPPSKIFLLRGYLAVNVGGGSVDTPTGLKTHQRDVFIPGVKVFLLNLQTNAVSAPVPTDLSGRFTLRSQGPGRYRVCWKGQQGYVDGCSQDIISVGATHVHAGTVRITPDRLNGKATVLFGKVRMKDGSSPRFLQPIAGINAFGAVSLDDANGQRIQEVYVNNFSEYLLPQTPVQQKLSVRARIEAGKAEQPILPQANLQNAPFHPLDLEIGNTPPRIEPIAATNAAGRRLRTARPGDTARVAAQGSDPDGDSLSYRWLAADGSGTLSATNTQQVDWRLPNSPGTYSLTVFVSDGKGGYNSSTLLLRADTREIAFNGKVVGTDGPVVAGAVVEVNGQQTTTGPSGMFQIFARDADRFVFNIRKTGYALVSRIYDDGVAGGVWTMTRATVATIDPTGPNSLVDRRDRLNCPGTLSSRVDWRRHPALMSPQWQDGKGNVIQAGKLEAPLPWFKDQSETGCGPGIRVALAANSLVDERGRAPVGNVTLAVSTIDLMSPEQMPGDYTVREAAGTKVMQSYGAGSVDITQGARRFNLRAGATATVTIPVDRSQLAAGGPLPATIPFLFYNERDGVWVQEGTATLSGKEYMIKVNHFSTFNADTLKVNQSCIKVLSPSLPAQYMLEVTIPLGPGAAPKVLTKQIDNSSPSRHVVYNLPSATNVVLVPVRLTNNTAIGTFVVNTGGPQNPTTPNLPADPYNACSTSVTLTELGVPDLPVSGEFLHGLFSFTANNLDELTVSDPALKTALDTASAICYAQIDPRNRRTTFTDFKNFNGFPGGETRAVYANSVDLGFGRDMHCKKTGSDVACYVTNYGDNTTPDSGDVAAAIASNAPVASVAMEYSRIESPPGNPTEFDDPDRVVKFYVYNAAGTLVRSANLDGLGARPVPQLCMVCHGGEYPGGPILNAAPPFSTRNDTKLGSQFLPFDLRAYTYGPAPFDKASQQPQFKILNEQIVKNTPPDAVISDLITQWYAGNSPTQIETAVVGGWNGNAANRAAYRNMMGRACRTCHVTNSIPSRRFDQAQQLMDIMGAAENRVCSEHVMPHSNVTYLLFWTAAGTPNDPTGGPSIAAQFQAFGDTTAPANPLNGWLGTACGSFTPGGITPQTFFSGTIQPIFSTKCTQCHIGGSPPANLNLTQGNSYGQLVNQPAFELGSMNRVTPGNANQSYLFHKVQGTQAIVGGSGQRMPADAPALQQFLTPQQLSDVQTWINTGAQQ